ncbi:unnamed protein product [Rotaria magnacalcarata]|uniref:Uncharacterized protein n=1 Tax=Rotaria magnacalcarata TaxID=392030 RepID=A0A8S3H973_9BILA|nr:unnamed protein product [Rotaria magnacalcarata]
MVCCEKYKQLLAYRSRDGAASLAKHKCSCQTTDHAFDTDNTPAQVEQSDNSRAFETVTGVGLLKMVQSIFDAGRYFSRTSHVSVKEIIPSPITISRHID